MNEKSLTLHSDCTGFLEMYNTTKIIFSDGLEKIKKTSYTSIKGLSFKNCHNGSYDLDRLNDKTQQYLRQVKSNIMNLSYNYNKWEYFITLTFDFRRVGDYSHDLAIKLLIKWLDNQKHQNKNMTYLLVPEFHKSGRLHFHGLIANVEKWKFSEAKNKNGKLIIKNGLQIYNLDNYKLGFTTISKIQSQEKVSNYISKYATKDLITLKNKKRYWYSRNLEKPRKEYLYLENSLLDIYKESNVCYQNTIEKSNCQIELLNHKPSFNKFR